jgi:hypothetical protein
VGAGTGKETVAVEANPVVDTAGPGMGFGIWTGEGTEPAGVESKLVGCCCGGDGCLTGGEAKLNIEAGASCFGGVVCFERTSISCLFVGAGGCGEGDLLLALFRLALYGTKLGDSGCLGGSLLEDCAADVSVSVSNRTDGARFLYRAAAVASGPDPAADEVSANNGGLSR